YTTVSGESGLLSSITDPLGHQVSYGYALSGVTNTVWVNAITEPAGEDPVTHNARTQSWAVGLASTIIQGTFSVGLVSGTNTTVDASDLYINIVSDGQLRFRSYHNDYNITHDFSNTTYDSANNVTAKTSELFRAAAGPIRTDNYTYGPHGNQLTHTVSNYSGTETTTWYNASQYFARASVTDMNGHTTTFIVGDNQGHDPTGQQGQSNGNKGSVLYVRDAGYSISGSPSYQKQYVYTYNTYGQKTSETNLGVNGGAGV